VFADSNEMLGLSRCSARILFGSSLLNVRRNRERQRGGSKFSSIMMLLVLGSMAFAAFKIVPAYFANYQLQDSMVTEARFAMVNRKAATDVQDDIWKKVQELGIPAKKDDIQVTTDQGLVQITVNYSVPVDLIVYQYSLQFHPQADNKAI
jgi:hypothetical protein